jgi:hypothetical protein
MVSVAVSWRKRHKTFERYRLPLRYQRRDTCAADQPKTLAPARPSTPWNGYTRSLALKS